VRHRGAGEGEHLGDAELLTGTHAKRLALVACILGSGIAFLDSTIVNVALPAIQRDLGGGLAAQQWIVDAYLLTLGSLLLVGGSLGDILGERRVFAAGVGAFGACSALCAAAPDAPVLIAARGLQGIAGALLTPAALAVIVRTFPPAERGRAIGTWTAWSGIAIVIGPLAGGELLAAASWRWIFLVNVPLAAVTVALVLAAVPQARGGGGRLDLRGAALCVGGLGGSVFALIEQRRLGWASPGIFLPLVGGVALLAAFVWWERRAPAPMLPLRLFARRNFAVANVETFAVYAGLSTLSFFLVLFLQQLNGWSPLRAGAALLPVTILMFLLSRLTGGLAARIGPRLFMGGGPLLGGLALLWLVRLRPGLDYLTDLLPALVLFGVGLSLTVAPLTATVLADAGETDAGIASGTNTAVARIAGLLGIALVGLAVGAGNHLDVHGFHLAMLATALLVAAGGVVGAVGIVNR
jgi:EmrB/QacA subfamily drug resistance transporter